MKYNKTAIFDKELSLTAGSDPDSSEETSTVFGKMFRGRDDSEVIATDTWASLSEALENYEPPEANENQALSSKEYTPQLVVGDTIGADVRAYHPLKNIDTGVRVGRRSIWKGPFVDAYVLKKAEQVRKNGGNEVIKVWSRRSTILPQFIGLTFSVFNGKKHIPVSITEEMVGQKFGEYSPTKVYFGKKDRDDKSKKTGSKK